MNRLRTVLATAGLLTLLLLLGLLSLTWNLLATVLYPLLSRQRGLALGRRVISRCYGGFWAFSELTGMIRIESQVMDRFRDEPGLIIAANHPSMMDALILVARLPRSACIMKADLMKNVFLGAGARLARYIRNDAPHSMIRRAVHDLRSGGQLVIFPEGTRTTQWPVNPFNSGVALIAKIAQAPIQTVFIDTDSPYLGKGWPLWRLPPLPIVFQVRVGERFAPSADPAALSRRLEQYFATDALARKRAPC